jgi:ankyrin repeat protein
MLSTTVPNGEEETMSLENLTEEDLKNPAIVGVLLHEMAEIDGADTIGTLLAMKVVGVDVRDKYQFTPLATAASRGSAAAVTELLSQGADIQAVDTIGNTPMHDAVRPVQGKNGDKVAVIKQLAAAGADVNAPNQHGETPMHMLFASGPHVDLKVAKALLDAGARVDIPSARHRPHTALEHANMIGNNELVTMFKEAAKGQGKENVMPKGLAEAAAAAVKPVKGALRIDTSIGASAPGGGAPLSSALDGPGRTV